MNGKFLTVDSLSDRIEVLVETNLIDARNSVPHYIGCVDIEWKRIFFPYGQRLPSDGESESETLAVNPVTFALSRPKQQTTQLPMPNFKSIKSIDPFSEFGWRRVTMETPRKPIYVFQAITEITPQYVIVESTNCKWKLGMALKSIPTETLDELLKKQLQWDDAQSRIALIRFYAQAKCFPQAFDILMGMVRDFPDKQEFIEPVSERLVNDFGNDILRRMERHKRAGQHAFVEAISREMMAQQISESARQSLSQNLTEYEMARQKIENLKLLLRDWQSQLVDPALQTRVNSLYSEVSDQLDFETLSRLDAFIEAESDNHIQPEQRLSLAYSGWVLGSDHAITNMDQTLQLWEARDALVVYLRDEHSVQERELLERIHLVEGISSNTVQNMVVRLAPYLDSNKYAPGVAHRIESEHSRHAHYSIMLPDEYSTQHKYPLIVALRSCHRSHEETLSFWTGDVDSPDLGNDRGYVVISPEYVEQDAVEYLYQSSAHQCVLDCLIDARKRFAIDSDRVFLAGHGMGADAAFDIGLAHPDEFAGVIPIDGNIINHSNYCGENGSHTAWYVIGKGYDFKGTRESANNPVFEKMLKRGCKSDFMLVEYMGRSGETITYDIPQLFDWMDLHSRAPLPKQFNACSFRRSDNRFFWVTAKGLPRETGVSVRSPAFRRMAPMEIEVRAASGNVIHLKSPTESYSLRLMPEFVDFDKRLTVKIGDRVEFNNFVKPDVKVLLEELRLRGDRTRLPVAVLSL